jgi:hypothetical protein
MVSLRNISVDTLHKEDTDDDDSNNNNNKKKKNISKEFLEIEF